MINAHLTVPGRHEPRRERKDRFVRCRPSAARARGLLCVENDHQTAEAVARSFDELGVTPSDYTPWNAYPWYINRKPTTAEIRAGTEPLLRLIELLPRLSVVLLCGNDAQAAWKHVERARPDLTSTLLVIPTYHPSRQAIWTADENERARRIEHRTAAFRAVAEQLGNPICLAPRGSSRACDRPLGTDRW